MILKSPMNALHNVTNPYQGPGETCPMFVQRLLLRSQTLATVLYEKYGYIHVQQVVICFNPVTTALLEWADEIICVEQEVDVQLMNDIRLLVNQGLWVEEDIDEIRRKTITLDIPDIYETYEPTLQRIIIEQYGKQLMKNNFNINLENIQSLHRLQLLQLHFFW